MKSTVSDFLNFHWSRRSDGRYAFLIGYFVIALSSASSQQTFDPARGIVLHGTVVTMDAAGTILDKGNVLVRNGKILAVWAGSKAPNGTAIDNAIDIDLGPNTLVFPGLINLHNHPRYNMLEIWPAPSSHVQTSLGRPLGTRALRKPLPVEPDVGE